MGSEEHCPQAANEGVESDSLTTVTVRTQPVVLACTVETHCVFFLLSRIGSDPLSDAVVRESPCNCLVAH